MEQVLWADRGHSVQSEAPEGTSSSSCIGVSRLGSAQLSGNQFSVWIQLRGSAWVEAKEGRFRLRRGQWIALEKDSRPTVQTDAHGLCIGLSLSSDALQAITRFTDCGLYAGRGHISPREARTALSLWRAVVSRAASHGAIDMAALRPMLMQLTAFQRHIAARVSRCPGRSGTRKRQVFSRLQRAHLYLEGNCDRVVRISELAELTSFSSWYFSKTFHGLYDESPQAAAARMRLEQAADLLVNTSMMVGEVAAASGFDNCCSFARAFRARYGMSASRYRTEASRPDSAKFPDVARKAAWRTGT
ncbi:helix-turn-helix domain-containing protein [Marilutibacter aestuarii]|uniref:Helix-turn-helix domain-containing protein n=1 Tax=Marilutibacter aestuarii TaxID=1706195 RepID=A0A508AS22_9GAMM|nr:helix-turn-helix domain-containing protein [Lysobacter aestuarii]TQD51743.1 helix-turn-helix domain-containing protein [Lysobacter aestuarii]